MNNDLFEEYDKAKEPDKQYKGYVWKTAIGLQQVDGLEPSEYLIKTARSNIDGDITFAEAKELINSYYESKPNREDNRTEEADKVSARIAEILAERSFVFSPQQYISIHKRLFEGIYRHAGKIRDYDITKNEWVLGGDTVTYGSAMDLRATLDYDFKVEKDFSYKGLTEDEIIIHLARFVANLWQIHIFGEGNTRTTAVFFIKYLRSLGYDATNDIFADNAWYFRNALVRANYTNLQKNIYETTEYVEMFLRNLLFNEGNELKNRYLHISYTKNIDIEPENIDIQTENIDIKTFFNRNTVSNINKLKLEFKDKVFGRTDIVNVLGIKPSTASALIKKMLNAGIIMEIKGQGKGRYKFK